MIAGWGIVYVYGHIPRLYKYSEVHYFFYNVWLYRDNFSMTCLLFQVNDSWWWAVLIGAWRDSIHTFGTTSPAERRTPHTWSPAPGAESCFPRCASPEHSRAPCCTVDSRWCINLILKTPYCEIYLCLGHRNFYLTGIMLSNNIPYLHKYFKRKRV